MVATYNCFWNYDHYWNNYIISGCHFNSGCHIQLLLEILTTIEITCNRATISFIMLFKCFPYEFHEWIQGRISKLDSVPVSLNSVHVLKNSASSSSTLFAITLTLEPASFQPAVLALAEASTLSVDFPALLDQCVLFWKRVLSLDEYKSRDHPIVWSIDPDRLQGFSTFQLSGRAGYQGGNPRIPSVAAFLHNNRGNLQMTNSAASTHRRPCCKQRMRSKKSCRLGTFVCGRNLQIRNVMKFYIRRWLCFVAEGFF